MSCNGTDSMGKLAIIFSIISLIIITPGAFAVSDFVDPQKEPSHYILRYQNEPSYKVWFDENYPNLTIYDAVGITKSQYLEIIRESQIPESQDKCGPGTILKGDTCVLQKSCGPGTILQDGVCILDERCGPGTHLEGDVCVLNQTKSKLNISNDYLIYGGIGAAISAGIIIVTILSKRPKKTVTPTPQPPKEFEPEDTTDYSEWKGV